MRKCGAVVAGLLLGVVFCGVQSEDVGAVAYVYCGSNKSTENACKKRDEEGVSHGAMWLSAAYGNEIYTDPTTGATMDPTSDTLVVQGDSDASYVTFYLHGATTGSSASATCIGLGDWYSAGTCGARPSNDPAVDLGGTWSIGRKHFPGRLSESYADVRINLDIVRASWSHSTEGDFDVYTKSLWTFRCWGGNEWGYGTPCYSDEMEVNIKIKQIKVSAIPTASISNTAYIGEVKSGLSGSTSVSATGISNEKAASEYVRSENIAFYHSESQNGSNFSSGEVTASDSSSARQAVCQKFGGENCGSTMSFSDNNGSVTIEDQESYVGKKLCVARATNVAHYQYNADGSRTKVWSNTWTVSAASCVEIAKKPNTAIVGSSAYAKNGFTSSATTKSGTTYGSWGEFLVTTESGGVKNFGSGSSLANGESGSFCNNFSTLTISNINCSNNTAKAGGVSSTSNFKSQVENTILSEVKQQNSATISSTNDFVDSGTARVVYASGDITINGNIINNDKSKQYIIFGGNVKIGANVKQVDAWIIASGSVDTCAGATIGSLSANDCSQQLVINGLVYAGGELQLKRTYGAGGGGGSVLSNGSNSATAGEIINLTPASYAWAYNQASSTYANPTTVYTRELAPRV